MTQPGSFGSRIPVTDLDGLARRLRDIEQAIAELRANTLGVNGIVIGDRGSLRTADFDGTDFAHPGTKGVYLASEAGVGRLIVNEIYLRDGIVGNDALANPVAYAANGQAAGNFAVGTTDATVCTQTLTVPAGFSRAVVHATGAITAIESAGTADYLNFTVLINGTGSAGTFALATANQPGHVANSSVRTLTGLSGGVITITGSARTAGHNWTAQTSNVCTINATALFLR